MTRKEVRSSYRNFEIMVPFFKIAQNEMFLIVFDAVHVIYHGSLSTNYSKFTSRITPIKFFFICASNVSLFVNVDLLLIISHFSQYRTGLLSASMDSSNVGFSTLVTAGMSVP